ncbi:MAG TPA: hypothetical protein VGK25_10800 [Ignavibacteria bacterium]|jgi:hypothetical protein
MKHSMLFSIFILVICTSTYSQDKPLANNQTTYFYLSSNNDQEGYMNSTTKRPFRFVIFQKESAASRLRQFLQTEGMQTSRQSFSSIARFNIEGGLINTMSYNFTNIITQDYSHGITITFSPFKLTIK